jgi:hypothetical protein
MPGDDGASQTTADTIVLIDGLWMTSLSWEHWGSRYESRGFRVLAPAYLGFDVEVEARPRELLAQLPGDGGFQEGRPCTAALHRRR